MLTLGSSYNLIKCELNSLTFLLIYSVVKEEVIDDDTILPTFNGKVVAWVSDIYFNFMTYL